MIASVPDEWMSATGIQLPRPAERGVMQKLNRGLSDAAQVSDMDPYGTAEAIRRDFAGLVEMFEQQLANLPAGDRLVQPHVARAKAAADRGLLLSHKLIEALGR